MSTTLSATGRIEIPYTIDGITHKIHAYVRNPTLVGANWMVNSRVTDANDTYWTDVANKLAQAPSVVMTSSITWGSAKLQTLESGIWGDQAYHTITQACTGSAYQKGAQMTITLRDLGRHRFKIQWMESSETVPQMLKAADAGDSGMDQLIGYLMGTAGDGPTPYQCVVSRANQYIAPGGFVSCSIYYNRKLIRARGL